MKKIEDTFNKTFFLVFSASLFGLIFSKGLSALPGYSLDDYATFYNEVSASHFLSQGRYGAALVSEVLTLLKLTPATIAFPAFILLCIATSVTISLSLIYILEDSAHLRLGMIVAALVISTHPYFTEYFTFKQSLVFHVIYLSIISICIYMLINIDKNSYINIIIVTIGIVVSSSFLQSSFVLFFVVVFARMSMRCMAGAPVAKVLRDNKYAFIAVLIAAILYFVSFQISKSFSSHLSDVGRSSILEFSQIENRLYQFINLLGAMFAKGEATVSIVSKIFLLLCMLAGLFGSRNFKTSYFLLLFIIGSASASVIFVVLPTVWWPAPRSLYVFGFAIGIAVALSYAVTDRFGRYCIISFGSLAALLFGLHSTAMLQDQYRLNQWDRWAASSIAKDLLSLGVKPTDPVVLVGASWSHPVRLATTSFDLNVSALAPSWTAGMLMQEATGRYWNVRTTPSDPLCTNAPLWPESGSIIRNDGIGVIVCYGR